MLKRRMLRNPFSLTALALCGALLSGCGGDSSNSPNDLNDPDPNALPICSVLAAFVDLTTQEVVVDITVQDPDQLNVNIGMEVSFEIITNTGTFANDVTLAGSGNLTIGNTVFGVGYSNFAPGIQSQFRISSSSPQQLVNDPNAIMRVTVVDELGGTSTCDLSFDLNLVSEPTCAITSPTAGDCGAGNIAIDFSVMDNQGDPASANLFWSIAGGPLNPMTITATTAGALGNTAACNPANTGGASNGIVNIPTATGGAATAVSATWDSFADGVALNSKETVTITIYTEDCTTVSIGGLFNPPCTQDTQVLNNGAPICTITGPAAGSSQGGTGCVTIDYDVVDADSNVIECAFQWTTDMGATWSLATACAPSTNPQQGAPGVGSFLWDVPADIATALLPLNVDIRKTADDLTGRPVLSECTSGEFTLVPISEPSCAFTAPAAGTCVDAFPAGTIDLGFDVTDAQGDPISFSVCYDIGGGPMPATLTATSNGMLAGFAPTNAMACVGAANQVTGAAGGATTVTWDIVADGLGGMMCDAVTVTIYPEDGTTAGAGPFFSCGLDFQVANNGAPSCTVNSTTSSSINFDIVDADTGMVSALFEYSTDGGVTWTLKTASGGTNPENFAPGAGLSWGWNAMADLGGCTMGVVCRITVDDGVMLPNRPATCSGTPVDLLCIPVLANCRAVDVLGTAATGPTGVVPPNVVGPGRDPGAPPTSGDINDQNFFAANWWLFDYSGVNEGAFNSNIALTDAGGNNFGNPVVLASAGIDYSALMDGGVCTMADTFQVVLEGSLDGMLGDYAAPMTGVFNTTWMATGTGATVSAAGLLTGAASNACATIDWTIMSSDPMVGIVDPTCAAGTFVACVDEGGWDHPSRATWLPLGDIDGVFPGLPSGGPIAGVGGDWGIAWVVNTDMNGVGAYAARTEYDEAFMNDNDTVDTMSIGNSSNNDIATPFAVNTGIMGETRWNDVDAFGGASGIFDLASQTYTSIASGPTQVRYVNEELADDAACNIWVTNPCMPFNSFICPNPPPAGGYQTIAGTSTVTIP